MHNSPYELSPVKYQKNLTQSVVIPSMSRFFLKKQKQIQQTKMYHRMALQSFPFGKQGIKITEYVSSQMNSKEQDDNARILQEFRRKAIEDKFHNKHGNLRSSKVVNRYITENMMPGVTLNPSMVNSLEPQLKSYQQPTYHSSNLYASQSPTRQYTQPVYGTVDQLYNSRQKVSFPEDSYPNTISHSPQKNNIESQTDVSHIKSYHELDLQRKYYKLRCKYSKKALNNFDKVERLLHSLNKQLKENSKYLQNVIIENHRSICTIPRRSKRKSFSAQGNVYGQQGQKTAKRQREKNKIKYKTDVKQKDSDEESYQQPTSPIPDWKLNHEILYNSSQSSFCNKIIDIRKRPKPKVHYSSSPKKNAKNIESFFTPTLSKKHSRNSDYEIKRDNNINDDHQKNKPGIEKIRQHLKLLKRHANRLQTIKGHNLVH